MAPGIALKFYTGVAKRLKLKFRKFFGLIRASAKLARIKMVGEIFEPHPK